MKEIIKFLLLFLLSMTPLSALTNTNTIIPKPLLFNALEGSFYLSQKTTWFSNTPIATHAINYLQGQLQINAHYQLKSSKSTNTSQVIFQKNSKLRTEAYILHIRSHTITIEASSQSGFFYAVVSMMQLMDTHIWRMERQTEPHKQWKITSCYIEDEPRFKWRGMMLDSSRNFFSTAYVKKFIDRMAQHKLNVFHWHLTDDEGWRIEIKKYPLLTQVGAKRGPGTKLPFSLYPAMRGPTDKVQEGYYTQEEIKEIVAYAAARSVNILPEIDVPAHAKAAVMSYPELLQDPNDTSVYQSVQKVSNNTIDPGLKSSYQFLDDVIQEVAMLFPFEYIHLGGDEVPKDAWKGSPSVKRLMHDHKLKNSSEVQSYFFTKMDKLLEKHQRKLIGWQEIRRSKSNLRDTTIIMAWRGDGAAKKAVKTAQEVILSPAQFLYFDQQYVKSKNEFGHTWAGPTDTKEVYSYQPLHTSFSHDDVQYIRGVHACLWSETALTEQIADYLVWPRAMALSEVAWCQQKQQNWEDFKRRLQRSGLKRLKRQGVSYRPISP